MHGIEYKVFYYRVVKGLTQEQTAEIIDRSDRQIRNIEKKMKISCKFPVAIEK
jgi:DNA-binding XRE family transcriptional regulator